MPAVDVMLTDTVCPAESIITILPVGQLGGIPPSTVIVNEPPLEETDCGEATNPCGFVDVAV